MIERLQRALAHIDELPAEVQEELATLIEERTELEPGRAVDGGAEAGAAGEDLSATTSPSNVRRFAGIWADLPDDFLDELDRIRHESPPTPPIDLEDL